VSSQITITVPHEMDDRDVDEIRERALAFVTRFALPVVVQRPWGPTFQQWRVEIADPYHTPDRTMEAAE
jgi:hypothetical protein